MATWQRIGVAMFFTLALAVGGLLYNEVFVQTLLPVVRTRSSTTRRGRPTPWK